MLIIASSEYLFMGNKLIQFATFATFSEKNKIRLINPSFAPYSKHFKGTADNFFCHYPAKKTWIRGGKKTRNFFYRIFHRAGTYLGKKKLSNRFVHSIDIGWDRECAISSAEFAEIARKKKILFVLGWRFVNDYNLHEYKEKIKSYFAPLDEYRLNIDKLIKAARSQCDVLVGIHIRHGDYKNFQGGKYFYEIPEYAQMMKKFSEKFPGKKVSFLVCSNAPQQKESFSDLNILFGTGHMVEDMYSFAECDYIIGPPSTYTMWASFYGNKPLYMMESAAPEFSVGDFKVFTNLHQAL
jgi:hypothetical protein